MKPWAEHLAAQGYAVSVPRLPGHGTTWQEMNKTTWADWYGELERAFEALANQVDTVVVCGLSMGGALALRLAADHPDRVAGLVLVNPAVDTERKDVKLLPVLKHVIPSMPGIANDIKKPGVEEHGYTKTPLRAADSMFQAYKVLRADLGQVICPILLFRSTEDHVVDPSSGRAIRSTRRARPTCARRCSRTATTSPRSTTTPRRSSRARSPSSSASPASRPEGRTEP